MSFNLDEKQQAVRDLARGFGEKHIAPIAKEMDRKPPEFPMDLFMKMADAGFLAFPVKKEYGGLGKSKIEYVTLIEEIASFDASSAIIMAVNNLAGAPIESFGTEEQKKKYLPSMCSGEMAGAFALTEPNAGSDAANQQTTAKVEGDYFIINGEKIFITSGNIADIIVVIAKILEDGEKEKVSAILVEGKTPGLTSEELKWKMGLRASTTARLKFNNVKVPRANLLGEAGKGFRLALQTLDGARVGVAAQAVGIAQRAFDESIKYSKTRVQFGAPIAKLQAIQWMIADMGTRLEAARMLTYKAALMEDKGEKISREAAQAKLFASEASNFIVDRAMQIHGGYGYIGEFSEIEKLYRDQRITEIYEGTSEVQRLVISSAYLR
ncbi:MAG: acyl-CoA dehydrogenase family protein [candidate division Zixibacteria bacterium]|nr:acyl-CoA dehydrogenase family protein [candidate division Zixibacteria bacterium]